MNKSGSLDFPYDIPEGSVGFLLWQSSMCWQREINKTLAAHGLTYTQFIVLSIVGWLRNNNTKTYQHQVARFSRIDRMMTSRVLASLERKKLLKRVKQSDDARTNLVEMTDLGEDILTKALKSATAAEYLFFDPGNVLGPEFIKYMQKLLPDC
jgi:DNA-binding MarR family transcriptional regulator